MASDITTSALKIRSLRLQQRYWAIQIVSGSTISCSATRATTQLQQPRRHNHKNDDNNSSSSTTATSNNSSSSSSTNNNNININNNNNNNSSSNNNNNSNNSNNKSNKNNINKIKNKNNVDTTAARKAATLWKDLAVVDTDCASMFTILSPFTMRIVHRLGRYIYVSEANLLLERMDELVRQAESILQREWDHLDPGTERS